MPSLKPISLGRFNGYVVRGDDSLPPLLAVHGAFSHPEHLAALLLPIAAQGITSYALALTAHAEGTASAVRGLAVHDYVRDVKEMMRHLPSPPVLLGHSMGGLVCEKVAETEDVAGLILAAAAPASALMATFPALPTWLRLMPRMIRGVPLAPPRLAIAELAFTETDGATRQKIVDTLVPESGRAMRDMVLGAVRVKRDKIRCPVLAVFGDRDLLVPPWQMRGEAKRLGATTIEYAGAGHFLVEGAFVERIANDVGAWARKNAGECLTRQTASLEA